MRPLIVILVAGACKAAPLTIADPIDAHLPPESTDFGFEFDADLQLPSPDDIVGTQPATQIVHVDGGYYGYNFANALVVRTSLPVVGVCTYHSGSDSCELESAVRVPEPGTGLLLLSGLLLLAGRRRAA